MNQMPIVQLLPELLTEARRRGSRGLRPARRITLAARRESRRFSRR